MFMHNSVNISAYKGVTNGINMWFLGIFMPNPGKVTVDVYFPRWRGVSKANLNWTELQAKLEFPEVWGLGDSGKGEDSNHSHTGRGVDISWNNTSMAL